MGGGYKNCCALWSSSSSAMKKLLSVVPLIIVASGFVSILGSRTSTWVVFPNRSWSSSSSETKQNDAKKTEEMVDLQSRMVVVGLQDKEEALLNVDQLVLNKSSSPPLPVEAVHVQQSVELFFFSCFWHLKLSMLLENINSRK